MINYENLEIDRARSEHPRGMKHYNTDSILESIILDLELITYRLRCLLKGDDYEEKNIPDGAETEEDA